MHTINDAVRLFHAARHVAIATHIRPDGDALGSAFGLRRILSLAGKHAAVVALDPVPERYQFMVRDEILLPASATGPRDWDLLTVLDTGAMDRASAALRDWLPLVTCLNIDHHPTNTGFGNVNYVNPAASSTGEMVCDIARAAGYAIPAEAAEALWIAIITDTGRFAFSNTTPAALQTAATLVQTGGVATNRINDQIFNSTTAAQLRLHGRAINSLELLHEGRLAMVSLSREDLADCGCRGEDTEDIITIPRRITGVEVALFAYELPGEARNTKISLRASVPHDAAAFCQALGGGGHARAAGCTVELPLAEARRKILEAIGKAWFPA